jgi:DNA mismatch repair protein MSH5
LSSDGAGLFTGVIKSLLSLGDSCPLVFAATHFHEVLNTEILSSSLPISFVHMAVMITTDKGDVLEPRYQPTGYASQSENEGYQLVRPGEVVTYLFK